MGRKLQESVTKRRNIKFKRWGLTKKKEYNTRYTAKVWNLEYFILVLRLPYFQLVMNLLSLKYLAKVFHGQICVHGSYLNITVMCTLCQP